MASFQFAWNTAHEKKTWVVFCFRPAWLLSLTNLESLLLSPEVERSLLSIRAGTIDGDGINFSPKLPYIDLDFILINGARIAANGVAVKPSDFRPSHLHTWGFARADFESFIERVIPAGELHVYSRGEDLTDAYGEKNAFKNHEFLLSQRFGFVCFEASHWKIFMPLTEMALNQKMGPGVVALKKSRLQSFVSTVRRQIGRRLGRFNFELQKRY